MADNADFIVGSVVRDDDFWFRSDFIEDLWESIKKHNVLLLAPRRIGKTSVMYRMLDYPKDDWLVIHMNVEELKTPDEFFITLIDAINEHQPQYFKKALVGSWDFLKGVFSKIERVEVSELKLALRKSENLKESWKVRTEELMERILNSKQRILFIIDELPDMLNGILGHSETEYEIFLHWFRNTRMKSIDTDVRWLLGGSVNLVASLDKQGKVNLVNDLKVELLSPFSKDEVNEFVTDMLTKRKVIFNDSVVPRVWELLGEPIPFFLQMLTQEIYRKWKHNQSETITAEAVTEVFNKALLGEMARDKLQHYRTRIDTHYHEDEREAVCYLLSKLSISDNGISRGSLLNFYRQIKEKKTVKQEEYALNQAFQRLLLYLQSDFYIKEKEGGMFDFASRLLKIWWGKYYGYEYGDNKNA